MKILVFIEHDIIIRHFIHSGVFRELIEAHDVKFVFPEPGYKRVHTDVSTLEIGAPYKHLTVHQKRLELWKRLFITDALRWRPGDHFASIRRFRRETIGPKATALLSVLSLPGIFSALKWWTLSKIQQIPYTDLDDLLGEERPDMMIHPSILEGVYINDLVEASQKRNLPLIVVMNSWDNPSTKKAMVGTPDWLLVWGEQTKRHALEFMGIPDERVIRFGAAQFDLYRSPPRVSRQEFCQQHNIDPEKTILLYAGSSKETDEFHHLQLIDKAVENGQLGNTTVVYRPHPWGGGGKGGERLLDHPWKNVRIEESMRSYLEDVRAGKASIHLADYQHTHDVLSSIDALISPLSTIIIEGALHGKPVLCFLPEEEVDARHFQMTAPLIHFEDMYNMPEFIIAKGQDELLDKTQDLLQRTQAENTAQDLQKACDFFVEPFSTSYGSRLKAFAEEVASKA